MATYFLFRILIPRFLPPIIPDYYAPVLSHITHPAIPVRLVKMDIQVMLRVYGICSVGVSSLRSMYTTSA